MQHLAVSCAVRRFFKSLGFKGLSLDSHFHRPFTQSFFREIIIKE